MQMRQRIKNVAFLLARNNLLLRKEVVERLEEVDLRGGNGRPLVEELQQTVDEASARIALELEKLHQLDGDDGANLSVRAGLREVLFGAVISDELLVFAWLLAKLGVDLSINGYLGDCSTGRRQLLNIEQLFEVDNLVSYDNLHNVE